MGYVRAEKILPLEIIKLIQEYVEGENIYIPKREGNRQQWGKNTQLRKELSERNIKIYEDYQKGDSTTVLADKYFLSEKSIQRIIYLSKKNR